MSLRMAWIAPETVAPIKHLVGNFVGAAVLFAAAIALAAMEKWCAAQNMPSYCDNWNTRDCICVIHVRWNPDLRDEWNNHYSATAEDLGK